MKLTKAIQFNERQGHDAQLHTLDNDVTKLYQAIQGRLRFGRGTDGDRGENIQGVFQQFTSNGTPDTEDTIAHGAGATPVGLIILWQDKAGSLYQGPSTGTAWDATNVYLKCSVASVTFKVFFII